MPRADSVNHKQVPGSSKALDTHIGEIMLNLSYGFKEFLAAGKLFYGK